MGDKDIYLEVDSLSNEDIEKARVELRETPETRHEAIEKLRELLKNDKTLNYADDDAFLLRFLRKTHFYVESAYQLLKVGAEFRAKHKAILDEIPDKIEYLFSKTKAVNFLKNRDQNGRRIMINSLTGQWDPRFETTDEIFQSIYIASVLATLEPATQINGGVVIMDFQNMGMRQVTSIGPAAAIRLVNYVQDVMPLRLKEVHIINEPFIFNIVWKLFKPFLNEKFNKRVIFHGTKLQSLHNYIKPEYLPVEFNGKMPSINYSGKDWLKAAVPYLDYVRQYNSYGLAPK